jgi:PIN domain
MLTYAQILRRDLEEIVSLSDKLLEVSEIDYDPDKVGRLSRSIGAAILAFIPDSSWTLLDDKGRRRQRNLLDRWNHWLEKARLLFAEDAEKSRKDLEETAEKVTKWLDRSDLDFSIPKNLSDAPLIFRNHIQPLFDLLTPFLSDGPLVVVPDTNVILRNQELPSWAEVLGTDDFFVLLVPGVLNELDEHKTNHRVPEVREKARAFSNRVKGWRNQGSLSEGVRVQGKVYVRVAAREPDFRRTLSWLDPQVIDDRIIASVMEWQRSNPTNAVQLLSGDSIMLAKADEAGVPTGDVPDRQ